MCMWLYVYGANLGSKSMDDEYWIPKNWCLFEPQNLTPYSNVKGSKNLCSHYPKNSRFSPPICPPLQVVGSSEGLSQLQTIAQL